MTELRFETFTLPAATLAPANPLPPLALGKAAKIDVVPDPKIVAGDTAYLGKGFRRSCLPYLFQDQYDRQLKPHTMDVAVLENDFVKATVALGLGGRLWSLVDKSENRELLDVNPVFQPMSLAIRGAWFSGGVEWNIGLVGHCPFTCSPLFAAEVTAPDGTPVLRLYEWERVRRTPFQIDFCLRPRLPFLFVKVRIINPFNHDVPMYWWSNMAVPETADTRVIVPAETCYSFGYTSQVDQVAFPVIAGMDQSYAANAEVAHDYFFRLADGQRPWISALRSDGRGLVQTSTRLLKGRKLFVWGQSPGSRHKQDLLSHGRGRYIEIQAGVGRTQLEHLPMPPGSWSWLEAYGLMKADPGVTHGEDWRPAWRHVDQRLDRLLPPGVVEAEFEWTKTFEDTRPARLVQRGAGWGSLERRRRELAGEKPMCSEGLLFGDDALSDEQRPWLGLLVTGTYHDQSSVPAPPLVEEPWLGMLETSAPKNWQAWLQLGVAYLHEGRAEAACDAWRSSLRDMRNPWALRNLACCAQLQERWSDAADLMLEAYRTGPDCFPLLVECGSLLLRAGRCEAWLEIVSALPEPQREHGRIRILEGRAALAVGDLDRVARIIEDAPVPPDIRETESPLTDLWFGMQEQRISRREGIPIDEALRARVCREFPAPEHIDYRVQAE